MQVFTEKNQIRNVIAQLKAKQKTIGLIPTMGALHHGHLALIKQALSDNDHIVVSIFVNPTQFNNSQDLNKYPRTLQRDVILLKSVSEHIMVYAPTVDDIYSGNTRSEQFDFDGLEFEMEGMFRQGHFDGVGTVVKHFFEIVEPHNAYFGEKDFQQLMIIKKLVSKYKIPVNVIGCKIYREDNGLAMSSRNERLEPKFKKAAPFIYKTIKEARHKFKTNSIAKVTSWVEQSFLEYGLLKLEYFVIADIETLRQAKRKSSKKKYRAFIAVYAGDIRLIDNIALN